LFDWRGILVHDPDHAWWVARALRTLGRPVDPEEVSALVREVREAERRPEHLDAALRIDTSAAVHREASLRLLADAGLDDELAEALYLLDFDPACHRLYPDVVEVLTTLRARGVMTAVVSDIHFDLRPEFVSQGIAGLVDVVVLSFEHGVQKPDPKMFSLALEALGTGAADTVMVGDRVSHDGGAAAVGITTLILPATKDPDARRLGAVVDLVG
jgi:HAD superfamily hydrolase (TIGR01509 family)